MLAKTVTREEGRDALECHVFKHTKIFFFCIKTNMLEMSMVVYNSLIKELFCCLIIIQRLMCLKRHKMGQNGLPEHVGPIWCLRVPGVHTRGVFQVSPSHGRY